MFRYGLLSEHAKNFVVEPHNAIVGDMEREVVLNMTAKESEGCQKTSTDIAKEEPRKVMRMLKSIRPAYQKSKGVVRVEGKDSDPLNLTQVSALLQGGVPYYELVQSNAMLAKAIQAREQGEEGRFRILINELFKRDDILRALGKALLKRLNEEDATDS